MPNTIQLKAGNVQRTFPADQAEKLLSYPGGSGWELDDNRFIFNDGVISPKPKKKADVAATDDTGSTGHTGDN